MCIRFDFNPFFFPRKYPCSFSQKKKDNTFIKLISEESLCLMGGSVAEWLARPTRDLEVAGSIPDQAML